MKIVEQVRPKCNEKGCNHPAMLSGKKDGRYRKYCYSCYRKKYSYPPSGGTRRIRAKALLRDDKCTICGWDVAQCEVHRVKVGGKYTKENTITLCPNCHTAAHAGKLTLI